MAIGVGASDAPPFVRPFLMRNPMRVFVVIGTGTTKFECCGMFHTACETLAAAGNDLRISDLHEMSFDPVSSQKNFTTVKKGNLKLAIAH